MGTNNSCCCCLLRPADKYLKIPYTCLGKTEIYANMIKECFEIHLIILSDDGDGICEVCVGRLRDASDFKLQVQRSQAELQRLQGELHIKEEDSEKTEISDDDIGPDCREELMLSDVSEDMKTEVSDVPLPNDETEVFKESMIEGDPEKSEISDDDISQDCRAELRAYKLCRPGPLATSLQRNCIEGDPEKLEISDDDFGPDCRKDVMHVSGEMKTEISDCPLPSGEDKDIKEFMIDEKKEFPEVHAQEPLCPVTDIPRKEHYEQSALGLLAKQNGDNIREMCAQDTPRDSEAQGHHESGGPEKNSYTCDTCEKQFSSQAVRNRHIARVHQADTEHICKICDKRFKWKSILDKHYRCHTKEQQVFVCDVCTTQFTLKRSLICHIRSHTTVSQCKFCYRTFLDRPSLRTHIRTEHAYNKHYICNECKRVFLQKKHLTSHLNVHTKWRIYQCNICALTLSSDGSLRRHKLIHTTDRAYGCEVCKKRFLTKQALRRHKIIHTGEKNHCCDVCGKKFALSDYLRIHLKIHAEGTSFPCELCPKSYSTKECLRWHKRTHTKEKPVAKSAKKEKRKRSKHK